MAGAGYKLFATGDVLTAAQVNTYLMQQTVMVFASSAARTSALSGVLAEGMVSYLQDTNTLEVYDGAAWIGATGDITALTAGTGISISSATGPVPTVAIDTTVTADLTTSQTLTNKTLTSPVLTTPSISNINAKGDILVGTADNTLGIITAGSNGDTLVADSSTSTGLRWQGSAIGKNAVINGACEIAQRGSAAVTLTAAAFNYPVDRFIVARTAGTTGATAQQITSTGLDGFQYAVRIQRTAANTATNELQIGQTIETVNSIPFAGKTVVLSFWARAGANYSPTSSALSIRLYTGTGTDQGGYGYNFTGTAAPINSTATLTTSWQRFQYTATLATTTTEMQFLAFCNPTGTAGAADYFDITGVQVELGSIATPFSRSQGTIQGELAACQRYYSKSYDTGTAPADTTRTNSIVAIGVASTSRPVTMVRFPVTMRTSPTVTIYAPDTGTSANMRDITAGANVAAGAGIIGDTGSNGTSVFPNSVSTTANNLLAFHYTASAEL